MLLTPVSPHMLFDRRWCSSRRPSVALRRDRPPPGRPRSSTVASHRRAREGDAVVCRAGAHDARLVTFGGRDFHRILKAKFGLNDR